MRLSSTKLGFSLQLSSLRFLGTFCTDINTIPENAIIYVAAQLKINPKEIHNYKRRQTKDDHVKLIKNIYGYKEFSHLKKYLSNWLLNRAIYTTESTNMLFDMLLKKCLDEKIILPGFTTFSRFIASIVEKAEEQLYKQLALIPTNKEKTTLKSFRISWNTCLWSNN